MTHERSPESTLDKQRDQEHTGLSGRACIKVYVQERALQKALSLDLIETSKLLPLIHSHCVQTWNVVPNFWCISLALFSLVVSARATCAPCISPGRFIAIEFRSSRLISLSASDWALLQVAPSCRTMSSRRRPWTLMKAASCFRVSASAA